MKDAQKNRHLPVAWLIPNMVTAMALCAGLTSIRYAMAGKWEFAVLFIGAAVVLDGLDGRLARMLKSSSTFGAQLDSLSDFASFGIAPAVVLYLWGLEDIKRWGWGAVLFYAVCCALRLARFNTALFQEKNPNNEKFFTGVPTPMGATLAMLPLCLYLQYESPIFQHPALIIGNLAFVGMLMASRIPTLSLKKMKISMDMAFPVMMLCVLFISLLIIEPWITISGLVLMYYISIPITATIKLGMDKKQQKAEAPQPKLVKMPKI